MRALFFVGLIFCSTACATMQFERVDRNTLPKAEDYPGDGAVVILESQRAEYLERGGKALLRVTVKQKIQLLRNSGRSALSVAAFYDLEFSEVTSIWARTITPDGVEETFDRSRFEDRFAAGDVALFSDNRVLS